MVSIGKQGRVQKLVPLPQFLCSVIQQEVRPREAVESGWTHSSVRMGDIRFGCRERSSFCPQAAGNPPHIMLGDVALITC